MTYVHAIIIHEGNDLEKTLNSIKDCYTVDVITRKFNQRELDITIGKYDRYYNVLGIDELVKKEINKLVGKTDSEYILILNSGEVVDSISEKLERYLKINKLSMVKAKEGLNKLVVSTPVFRWLTGFGEQDIQFKVYVQSVNEEKEYLVLNSIEELYERTANS